MKKIVMIITILFLLTGCTTSTPAISQDTLKEFASHVIPRSTFKECNEADRCYFEIDGVEFYVDKYTENKTFNKTEYIRTNYFTAINQAVDDTTSLTLKKSATNDYQIYIHTIVELRDAVNYIVTLNHNFYYDWIDTEAQKYNVVNKVLPSFQFYYLNEYEESFKLYSSYFTLDGTELRFDDLYSASVVNIGSLSIPESTTTFQSYVNEEEETTTTRIQDSSPRSTQKTPEPVEGQNSHTIGSSRADKYDDRYYNW